MRHGVSKVYQNMDHNADHVNDLGRQKYTQAQKWMILDELMTRDTFFQLLIVALLRIAQDCTYI